MLRKWLSLAVVATILLIVAGKPIRRDNTYQCASSPCLNNGMCRLTYPVTAAPKGPTKAALTTKDSADATTKAAAYATTKAATTIKPKGKGREDSYSSRTDSNGYTCFCPPGWKDERCQTDIDECVYSTCSPGKSCKNTPGNWQCDDIDECQADHGNGYGYGHCKNNAKCNNGDNDYSCDCSPSFKSKNCDEDVDECAYNRGNCKAGTDCENTYGGRNCNDIDECKPDHGNGYGYGYCKNNAKCNNGDNDYSCDCSPYFKSKNCDEDVDECAYNRGNCKAGTDCENTYGGRNCNDIDECKPDHGNGYGNGYCKNNAKCNNGDNDYSCDCSPYFKSKNCDEDVDECEYNNGNCKAGTTCENTYGGFNCNDIDECLSTPCLYGGTCINGDNMYTCDCSTARTASVELNLGEGNNGWTGVNCEVNVDECTGGFSSCGAEQQCFDLPGLYDCEDLGCQAVLQECQNGGSCIGTVAINQESAPQCQCATGFTGPTCAANIVECDLPNMCPDGFTCLDTFGSYDCLDVCASNPCQNGGACYVVSPGIYRRGGSSSASSYTPTQHGWEYNCECTYGFDGENCELVYVPRPGGHKNKKGNNGKHLGKLGKGYTAVVPHPRK